MARSAVTILDIAEETGVSKSTVANVLSGSGRFSSETAELVREAADRMGYVSNRAARSLRTRRSGAFGLFIPPETRTLAFYMEFAFGAAQGAETYSADLTLLSGTRASRAGMHIDGALVIDPAGRSPVIERLVAARIPVVSVGRYEGPEAGRLAGVFEAHHSELQTEVLEHLWARGRRRPVLLAADRQLPSRWGIESRETFENWCAAKGLPTRVVEVPGAGTPREMLEVFSEAIGRHGADAVICGAQGWAARTSVLAEQRGMRAGDDLDIVTYVAGPDERASRGFTAIDLRPLEYGAEAARFLGEVVERNSAGGPEHRYFEGARVVFAGEPEEIGAAESPR